MQAMQQLPHDDALLANELVAAVLKKTGLSRSALRDALPRGERLAVYDRSGPWSTATEADVAAGVAAQLLLRLGRELGVSVGDNDVLRPNAMTVARELLA